MTAFAAVPTAHAAWCSGSDLEEFTTECHSDTAQTMVRSSVSKILCEDRARNFGEIRMHIRRECGPYRHDLLNDGETHTVSIGLGPEGWDAEPFVTFTLAEVAEIRDKLDCLLRWAESDPVKPGD
jgi:hypothetical protein